MTPWQIKRFTFANVTTAVINIRHSPRTHIYTHSHRGTLPEGKPSRDYWTSTINGMCIINRTLDGMDNKSNWIIYLSVLPTSSSTISLWITAAIAVATLQGGGLGKFPKVNVDRYYS